LQKQLQKADSYDANLNQMIEKYSDLINNLEKSRKQIIKEANDKAISIIESSNKAVEKTIRDIKEAGADKTKTQEIRKELYERKDELTKNPKPNRNKKKRSIKKKENKSKPEIINNEAVDVGDFVKIKILMLLVS